jgi:hypothetical protein
MIAPSGPDVFFVMEVYSHPPVRVMQPKEDEAGVMCGKRPPTTFGGVEGMAKEYLTRSGNLQDLWFAHLFYLNPFSKS